MHCFTVVDECVCDDIDCVGIYDVHAVSHQCMLDVVGLVRTHGLTQDRHVSCPAILHFLPAVIIFQSVQTVCWRGWAKIHCVLFRTVSQ